MHRRDFEREMHRAQAMRSAGDRPDYWAGYQRGLRRAYHGGRFGTAEEHAFWITQAESNDPMRSERGRGYRDGLEVGAAPPVHGSGPC